MNKIAKKIGGTGIQASVIEIENSIGDVTNSAQGKNILQKAVKLELSISDQMASDSALPKGWEKSVELPSELAKKRLALREKLMNQIVADMQAQGYPAYSSSGFASADADGTLSYQLNFGDNAQGEHPLDKMVPFRDALIASVDKAIAANKTEILAIEGEVSKATPMVAKI